MYRQSHQRQTFFEPSANAILYHVLFATVPRLVGIRRTPTSPNATTRAVAHERQKIRRETADGRGHRERDGDRKEHIACPVPVIVLIIVTGC
jgi:hypothetical protein